MSVTRNLSSVAVDDMWRPAVHQPAQVAATPTCTVAARLAAAGDRMVSLDGVCYI